MHKSTDIFTKDKGISLVKKMQARKDYKPTALNYLNALIRVFENSKENQKVALARNRDKIIFLLVKYFSEVSHEVRECGDTEINNMYMFMEEANKLIAQCTPREFMKIFPIDKKYDGEKWQIKDYFSCIKGIREKGIDATIGNDVFSFLWDYYNSDTMSYVVVMISILSKITEKDLVADFFGLETYTYYEKEEIMVNNSTGEVSKVCKPKRRRPKYLKVVWEE